LTHFRASVVPSSSTDRPVRRYSTFLPYLSPSYYVRESPIQIAAEMSAQSIASSPVPFERLPEWLHRPIGNASQLSTVQRIVKHHGIHTICEEGRCPNRGECYSQQTATFLLMGPICTRSCAFCQVDKGHSPQPLDPNEPEKVAQSVQLLGLRYVVLTSVARDDLDDQGARWFAQTIQAVRRVNPDTRIEVLTPDFRGEASCIQVVLDANPACFNHNLETVRRLQGPVRRGAKYERSLFVLETVKRLRPDVATKSGLMLGLGETEAEVLEALADLRQVGCDRLTLGQYMRPSLEHLPVQRYWPPENFERIGEQAKSMGFSHVRSGPLVRSSYHAGEG
jgi:lipoyl synthase